MAANVSTTAGDLPVTMPDHMPDLSDAAITALLHHPRFDAALRCAAASLVRHYHGNWVLNRLAGDRGRVVMGFMILDLHYASNDRGFTAAQVQDLGTRIGVSSRGRLMAFLAAMRLAGLLRPRPDEDRRLRRLAPTEAFFGLHRTRLRSLFEALAMLFPETAAAIQALDSARFVGAFAHGLAEQYRRGVRVIESVPALRPTAERDAGLVVLLALLLAERTGEPIAIAALARQFSVSRAHVLAILREARGLGLATSKSARGGYCAGPELEPALSRFCAVMFLLQLHAIRFASGVPGIGGAGDNRVEFGSAA